MSNQNPLVSIGMSSVLNKSNSLNDGCTIVIPTYNRPKHLKRILSYYNEYGRDYNIIVADSSSDENKNINKEFISSLSVSNIVYLGNYHTTINVYHKIADALTHVKTRYCAICADDDFITPNGINKSVKFLENNPDFTIAHGRYIFFNLESDTKGRPRFRYRSYYSHKSISFPSAKSRLFFYFSNIQISPFYAVYRAEFLKMIFKEVLNYSDGDLFGELLHSAFTLIYGNMKCLDVFYSARELIPGSQGTIIKNLKIFIKDGTYNEKYAKFKECLAIHLSKESQLDIQESNEVIDSAMSLHMKKYYSYRSILTTNAISKISNILNSSGLPNWMKDRIRILYRKLFIPKEVRADDFINSLSRPSSKYYNDFNIIRDYVLQHSKK